MSDDRSSVRAAPSPVWWWDLDRGAGTGTVAYRGPLAGGAGLRMRFGLGGWAGELGEVPAEPHSPGLSLVSLEGLEGHHVVDLAFRDGTEWDNNHEADFRMWVEIEPVDSHLHAATGGRDRLGLEALDIALASAGISTGVISWQDNASLDELVAGDLRFRRLVWVDPSRMRPQELERRLRSGDGGIKLHPTVDDFPADDHRLDPFLEATAAAGRPVAVHSGPGNADPTRIARLAARFPSVPVILYHTYLGLPWGRRKAAHHARIQPNLILETSWCRWAEVERLVDDIGPDRVIYGSDASVDGPHHFARRNVEGRESYKEIMLRIARDLEPDAARKVLRDNARRLFDL